MIISRYLVLEVLRPLVLGVGLLMLVFLGYGSARELTLAAKGVIDLGTALRLIGLNTLTNLDILLPSALFFSVLAGLGRLHRDGEVLVLAAAGVSSWRLLRAVAVLAVAVALLVGLLSITGRPWLYRQIYQLEAQAATDFDLKQISAGSFVALDDTDFVFIAEGFDSAAGRYQGIFLHRELARDGASEIIFSRSAELPDQPQAQAGSAIFHGGQLHRLDHRGGEDLVMKFDRFEVALPQLSQRRENYRRKAETTENLAQSASLKDVAEYQWRLAAPVLTALLGLIAVPLARSGPRNQRAAGPAIAIGVYVAVFSYTTVIRTWVEQGVIPPLPGIWLALILPVLVLLALLRPLRGFRF